MLLRRTDKSPNAKPSFFRFHLSRLHGFDLATLAPEPSRTRVVASLVDHLVAALDRFEAQGFAAFADAYARHDALHGREVDVLRGAERRQGIARGIDARGALRVAFAGGEETVDAGEVSLRVRA